jgi:hypothetical protein
MHNWLINKMCLFRCVRQLRVSSVCPLLLYSRQNGQGPLFELSKPTHLYTKSGQGYEALHPYGRQQNPEFPVNRPAFDGYDRPQYWIDRARGAR